MFIKDGDTRRLHKHSLQSLGLERNAIDQSMEIVCF